MEAGKANGWGNKYRKSLDSGIDNVIDGRAEEITYQETHPDSYFSIYKTYDSTGYIKEKGLIITKASSLLSRIGTWYFFDRSGKLINEINYDKPFTFTFNDVLDFCKKEGFPVTKGNDNPTKKVYNSKNELITLTYETKIDRGNDEYKGVKCWWEVSYYSPYGSKRTDVLLDGKTGKVMSRESGVIVP